MSKRKLIYNCFDFCRWRFSLSCSQKLRRIERHSRTAGEFWVSSKFSAVVLVGFRVLVLLVEQRTVVGDEVRGQTGAGSCWSWFRHPTASASHASRFWHESTRVNCCRTLKLLTEATRTAVRVAGDGQIGRAVLHVEEAPLAVERCRSLEWWSEWAIWVSWWPRLRVVHHCSTRLRLHVEIFNRETWILQLVDLLE